MVIMNIPVSETHLADFCRRWKIAELALFGSSLRGDARLDSDIDLLVTFSAGANWGVLDHFQMEEELEKLLGRSVDLVSRLAVERSHNWLRRDEILSTARTVYAA
jgi:predicted nucleotidyltransferase